jgi:cysteine desulfurase / selenocysteine lyase
MLNAVEKINHKDVREARTDFPIFEKKMNGKPLVYLDTGASAQKPQVVIDKMRDVMEGHYANIHRGLYQFSQETTSEFEAVRGKVASFINAPSENNIVFTRNATEAINLVAQSWGRTFLKQGDEILISEMEHHANIVPWQILRDQIGIVLKVVKVTDEGDLDLDDLQQKLTKRTRLVSLVHVSNSLGTINPVRTIREMVKYFNPDIRVLFDGSQAVVHAGADMRDIDPDFYVFTGHKLYGPTGVGVLYGKLDVLNDMPPYQGGGDMIDSVTFDATIYKDAPHKFEAGTPAIIEVIGLGAAIDYFSQYSIEDIYHQEQDLLKHASGEIGLIEGLNIHGQSLDKAGIISLYADWAHMSDIAMILDQQGVAVRSGHHCCMPLMQRFNIEGTLRISFGIYNNNEDVERVIAALHKAKEMLT